VLTERLWRRLVEVKKGRQVRLGDVLAGLPSKTCRDAEELLSEIEAAEKRKD